MSIADWKALFSRRELFRGASLSAAAGALRGAPPAELRIGPDIYRSIGLRPIVNCKGTFTIISGSQTLPEVKRAMDEASRHYIHLDELMDAVGARLAELTGAEWGIVTAGCAAALTHATAACIAGADPEKLQRLPVLTGLKNEVVVPLYSRNIYDHAVRMLGVRMVEVERLEQLEAAFNERTAMVMILAGASDQGPLGTRAVSEVARRKGVPVIVDAAAEFLTIPNVHLQRGAHLVAYSGGKCIRGPQCAGLLLGQKDLVRAAWLHSAPHHAFGRSLKVGKEEIMGMLAAVEAWTKRDHKAEWKQWEGWLGHIARAVEKVPGVTTEVLQPEGLSNRAPRLVIRWDGQRLGITGQELEQVLNTTEPRIILGGATGHPRENMASSITVMPYMMTPGDEKIAAARFERLLSSPPKLDRPPKPSGPPADIAGRWDLRIEFFRGSAAHALVIEQQGGEVTGKHRGDILSGDLRGTVEGNQVRFRSSHKHEGTRLGYEFTGQLKNSTLEGKVLMGEYGEARWQAKRL